MNSPASPAVFPIVWHDKVTFRRSAVLTAKTDLSDASVWAVDQAGSIFRLGANGQIDWHCLPAGWHARHIAIDGERTVWTSARASDGCDALWCLPCQSHSWEIFTVLARLEPVAGASAGGVFVGAGQLFKRGDACANGAAPAGSWPQRMSQGADGTLWGLSELVRYGGYAVMRHEANGGTWTVLPEPAAALRVAGAPDGTAWSVNSRGDLWRVHPDGAGQFAECSAVPECGNCLYSPQSVAVRDIAVDAIGNVWFLSRLAAENGSAIGCMTDFAARAMKFPSMSQGAVEIAADYGPAHPRPVGN